MRNYLLRHPTAAMKRSREEGPREITGEGEYKSLSKEKVDETHATASISVPDERCERCDFLLFVFFTFFFIFFGPQSARARPRFPPGALFFGPMCSIIICLADGVARW